MQGARRDLPVSHEPVDVGLGSSSTAVKVEVSTLGQYRPDLDRVASPP
jgi:hypothetical protein